jgi:hypothetical protein
MSGKFSLVLAKIVLVVHLAFIMWVMMGARLARGRPRLALMHVVTLRWRVQAILG